MSTTFHDEGRYGVTVLTSGYAVIDKQDGNRVVSMHQSRDQAHATVAKLNKEGS